MSYVFHVPQGDPCSSCGTEASRHRVEHPPDGEPCSKCGLSCFQHRVRSRPGRVERPRNEEYRQRKNQRKAERRRLARIPRKDKRALTFAPQGMFVGVDGEGQGRKIHRYVFLAASNETGSFSQGIRNEEGLSTKQCLDFLLELGRRRFKGFAYSFNYDLTKILEDLDDESIYKLFRPELRQRQGEESMKGPKAVRWKGYRLNLQGTKFSIARKVDGRYVRFVLWDIWKFYQGKFTDACKNWQVGGKPELDRMVKMKDQRADFDKLSPSEVEQYCYEECRYMATLARKLVEAHEATGLKLKNFYGAGSSASAMLTKMGIKERITLVPDFLRDVVASSFFGGRFENSRIGKIEQTVYNYDISSAYPYQLCCMPCLQHGKWTRTEDRKRLEQSTTAFVHYRLWALNTKVHWGPFPWRDKSGSICFPSGNTVGWIGKEEYIAGERLFDGVEFVEAWCWHQECDCQPFAEIPNYYIERVRIGKEGPGIVLKLGMNSGYGKLAQSVGRAIFNQWIWASLITSGTRAQLLDGMGLHRDMANLLMLATDGLFSLERLTMPKPKDTGTESTGKPLGGWEEKIITKGIFCARPGVYFPLNPTSDELKDVRARGVGKKHLLESWKAVVDTYEREGVEGVARVANVSRFCGAKSSVYRVRKPGRWQYFRCRGEGTDPHYGQWVTRAAEMSFYPMPKRSKVLDGGFLQVRECCGESTPYKRVLDQEAKDLKRVYEMLNEQPDKDVIDYELQN